MYKKVKKLKTFKPFLYWRRISMMFAFFTSRSNFLYLFYWTNYYFSPKHPDVSSPNVWPLFDSPFLTSFSSWSSLLLIWCVAIAVSSTKNSLFNAWWTETVSCFQIVGDGTRSVLTGKIMSENWHNESFTCVHLNRASAYFIVIARSPLLDTLPIRSFSPFDLLLLANSWLKIFDFLIQLRKFWTRPRYTYL